MDRRTLLFAPLGALAAEGHAGGIHGTAAVETIVLWQDTPPVNATRTVSEVIENVSTAPNAVSRRFKGVATPRLLVFRPSNPTGVATIILPGGGFTYGYFDLEGIRLANLLCQRGITAFVLFYRLANDGWSDRLNVGLVDAQRAVRLIRARAKQFRIDPSRVGVVGFSAGGYVAASLATRFDDPVYPGRDLTDQLSARPDFAGLIYPVQSLDPAIAWQGAAWSLFGRQATPAEIRDFSPHNRISKDTPPLFLAHAEDDTAVPIENSLRIRDAAKAAGVTVESHFFARGGHGFGVDPGLHQPNQVWPQLFGSFVDDLWQA
jgi:acetyl esterase/lipase